MTAPYLPLYISDYQADTSHLTTLEHGAYLLLIMNYWQRGQPLPDDDRKLARIAGVGPREWKRIRGTILEFFQVDCNKWFHSRLESELSKLRDKSLKKRNGGLARAQQMLSGRSARAQLNKGVGVGIIPSSNEEGAAPDADKVFWENAKTYLALHTKDPGKLIGKWIKDCGGDKTVVARAIGEAQVNRAVDPVTYIAKIVRRHMEGAAESSFTGFC